MGTLSMSTMSYDATRIIQYDLRGQDCSSEADLSSRINTSVEYLQLFSANKSSDSNNK